MFQTSDYLKLKAQADVSILEGTPGEVKVQYYEYDAKTGVKTGPFVRVFVSADLQVMIDRLQYRIDNLNAMIVDAGVKP